MQLLFFIIRLLVDYAMCRCVIRDRSILILCEISPSHNIRDPNAEKDSNLEKECLNAIWQINVSKIVVSLHNILLLLFNKKGCDIG